MNLRFFSRRKSTAVSPKAADTNKALSSELDELEAAYHVDDTFREPRQVEQLQRLLDRYHAKRGKAD